MAEHLYSTYWDLQNYRIIDCETCGFKHINPIPSQIELDKYYREKYFQAVKPFPYDQITAETIKNQIGFIHTYNFYIDIYEKVMNYKKNDSLKMADIGCGNDLLAKFFQDKNWEATVVEPSRDAGEYLKKYGLNVINKPVEDIEPFELNNLSFIDIQFVLEHLRDPFTILKKLYDLLLPGGIIRICVPNDFSEGQMAFADYFNEQIRWAYLPDHINYFTFDSLSKLLGRVGFKEVYRISNFPLEFLLMSGINYYTNNDDKLRVSSIVTNFESSFIKTGRENVLNKYYESLAGLGLGRSIFMYAVKE